MASSSQPFLNTHDSNLNANNLVFTKYDNSMNVEMLTKENIMLYIPKNVIFGNVTKDDVEDAPNVDAYISKLHLANLEKQHVTWKLYNHNLPTWAYFEVNNNQPIDLSQNQIMRCIVCHNNGIGPKIFALHTRLRKGLITYHKSNAITIMKKHVELEHNTLIKKFHKKNLMWLLLFHFLVSQPRSKRM